MVSDFGYVRVEEELDACFAAFGFQHGCNLRGGIVAEELAECLFVEGDVVLADERDEVGGSVTGQGGAGEVGIFREKILGRAVEVGEVAAATTGDEDFFADAIGAFEKRDAPAAFAGFDGAHEARGAGAENDGVVGVGGVVHGERCGSGNSAEWNRT